MEHKTNELLILICVLTLSTTIDGVSQTPIDGSKISTGKELNFAFTGKRGIKANNGIIYLVEK